MKKNTLLAFAYFPLLILVIYLIFFYSWNKQTQDNELENSNNFEITIWNIETDTKFWHLNIEDFKRKIWTINTVLIDLRNPDEQYKEGIIPNTDKYIAFDAPSFQDEISKLDKNKRYLIYCTKWWRSSKALEYMKKTGFTWVETLEWWTEAWIKAWEKTEKKEEEKNFFN